MSLKFPKLKTTNCIVAFLSSALQAFGMYNIHALSGVTEGGRTGLTSMTTGVLFLLATIFSPLFLTIPSFATAPALIIVGFYMMGSAVKIDFNDPSEGIPAFLTILAMPTTASLRALPLV